MEEEGGEEEGAEEEGEEEEEEERGADYISCNLFVPLGSIIISKLGKWLARCFPILLIICDGLFLGRKKKTIPRQANKKTKAKWKDDKEKQHQTKDTQTTLKPLQP